MANETPSKIGPYKITGELGRGGMGVVYDAVDDDGARVALKTVFGFRRRYLQGVRREIAALARLRHPGIVAIVDRGVESGIPWYAMGFVDGVTLRRYRRVLRSPTLSFADTATFADADSFREAIRESIGLNSELDLEGDTLATGPGFDLEGDTLGATMGEQLTGLRELDLEGDTMTGMAPDPAMPRPPTATVDSVASGSAGSAGGVFGRSTGAAVSLKTGKPMEPRKTGSPLEQKQLDPGLKIFQRLCEPLAYLHGMGLVHRDLKPANILVNYDHEPVILDFGLVANVSGRSGRELLDELGAIGAGTASYMAPEQVRGDFVDARADLYSVGCILYEFIAGHPPFTGQVASVLAQHITVAPKSLREEFPWVPAELDKLILGLLEKDPRQRPGHASDLYRELAHLRGDDRTIDLREVTPLLYRPGLAGRRELVRELTEMTDDIGRAAFGLALLRGPSGIGKTRLALEAGRHAVSTDALLITGECAPRGGRPLGALRRILQTVAERCTTGGEAVTTTLLGARGRVLVEYEPTFTGVPGFDQLPEVQPLPPREARRRLFDSLYDTLCALSQDSPLLVLVDDLQWADELTLSFLEDLQRRIEEGARPRFLILATVRDDEANPRVEALAQDEGVRDLTVGALGKSQTRSVIRDVLGSPETPIELSDFVTRHAGGNPFFINEYLRCAVDDRVIFSSPFGGWRYDENAAKLLPERPQDVVARRVGRLPDELRVIAEAAAVLSVDARLSLLARVLDEDEDALFARVDDLSRRLILETTREGGLGFVHDKLEEYAYDALSDERRAQLHQRAAEAIEAELGRSGDTAGALAYHYDRAGDAERAVDLYRLAGDRARTLFANSDAERHYQRAVELLFEAERLEDAARTLMKLGLVYTASFEAEKAQDAYDRAFGLWREFAPRDDAGAAMPGAQLAIAIGDPVSLDPARTYDSDSAFLQAQLFDGLVEIDSEMNVVPSLADRWETSADGTVYRFHLRPDAVWSDGRRVTAADFEFAWKRNLLKSTRAPAAALLFVLENAQAFHEGLAEADQVGVEALGPDVLEVTLRAPTAYFPYLLTHPITYPQPWWLLQKLGRRWTHPDHLVTNGPYTLFERDLREQLIITKSSTYRGRFPGNATEIVCRIYHDYRDALRAYRMGNIQVLDLIAAQVSVIHRAKSDHPDELKMVPLLSTNYVSLRADSAPLDDERVRRALALAIDRKALARELADTEHETAFGGFIPPAVAGHTPSMALPFDLKEARRLLKDAGIAPARFKLRWLHTHGLGDDALPRMIARQWEHGLGITVDLQTVQWEEFMSRWRRDPPHVALGGWLADYPDPDSFLRATFHSREGGELEGWSNRSFDNMVETAARTTDTASRLELYRKADHLLVAEEVAVIPVSYGRNALLISPRVARFPDAPSYLRYLKETIVASG